MKSRDTELPNKERIKWIDGIRALAVLCVILCHCTEAVYKIDAVHMSDIFPVSEVFAVICFTVGRLGVPFFLMISGYLLLDREYTYEQCLGFWKNKWLHLFVCTEIWIVVYRVFLSVYGDRSLNLGVLLEEMFFIRENSSSHLWYMPMILGIYLLVPVAANALRATDIKLLRWPLIIYGGFAFIYPAVAAIYGILGIKHSLSLQFSFGFSGGTYGIHFILGYLVKKGWFQKYKNNMCAAAMSVCLGITVIFQLWAFYAGYTYKLWYTFPGLCLGALAVFEIFSGMKRVLCYKVVRFIANYSFAVYLIHNIFRRLFMTPVLALPTGRPTKVLLLYLLVAGCSFPVAYLINHIPKIGKYILYTK